MDYSGHSLIRKVWDILAAVWIFFTLISSFFLPMASPSTALNDSQISASVAAKRLLSSTQTLATPSDSETVVEDAVKPRMKLT